MAMNKTEVLIEAASVIEENAQCLFQSHRNHRTGGIDDPEVAAQYRRELWLASRLREFAQQT